MVKKKEEINNGEVEGNIIKTNISFISFRRITEELCLYMHRSENPQSKKKRVGIKIE